MNLKEKLKQMKVKKKLNFYKICMLAIISGLGMIALVLSVFISEEVKNITEVWSPSLARVQELDNLTSNYRLRQYGHLVATSKADMDRYEKMLEDTLAEIEAVQTEFEEAITTSEEAEILKRSREKWDSYLEQSKVILDMSRQNRMEDARDAMTGEIYTTYQEFTKTFQELLAFEQEGINIAKKNISVMFLITIIVIVAAVILGIVVATVLSRVVTEIIVEPVAQITEVSKRLYEGDMSAGEMVTYESSDEFGIAAEALRGATQTLQDYIQEICENLREIAKGDLTKDSDEITNFRGDFADIKESFVYILKKFNSTLTEIQSTSSQVAVSSKEIAATSQTLADGASDQASAIEELTASIETVANLAEESARDTEEAYHNIRVSTENAEQEKQKMVELTEEMARITEISKEIEHIITAIEDIASQTNLLSLNASIEAARAGEAGRGFAVVADQIGKLATDSAESAINTRELIQKTLVEIENGNAITASTSEAFDKIIEQMEIFANVAQKTSETAKSQSASLDQIEQGIQQIADVVQNTSATSEESTAISENLSDEAVTLDGLVQRFKLY